MNNSTLEWTVWLYHNQFLSQWFSSLVISCSGLSPFTFTRLVVCSSSKYSSRCWWYSFGGSAWFSCVCRVYLNYKFFLSEVLTLWIDQNNPVKSWKNNDKFCRLDSWVVIYGSYDYIIYWLYDYIIYGSYDYFYANCITQYTQDDP